MIDYAVDFFTKLQDRRKPGYNDMGNDHQSEESDIEEGRKNSSLVSGLQVNTDTQDDVQVNFVGPLEEDAHFKSGSKDTAEGTSKSQDGSHVYSSGQLGEDAPGHELHRLHQYGESHIAEGVSRKSSLASQDSLHHRKSQDASRIHTTLAQMENGGRQMSSTGSGQRFPSAIQVSVAKKEDSWADDIPGDILDGDESDILDDILDDDEGK